MNRQVATLKAERETALAKADTIVRAAESAGNRNLTATENATFQASLKEADALNARIKRLQETRVLTFQDQEENRGKGPIPSRLTATFKNAFQRFLCGGMDAALYEGSDGQGGFAVPVTVDGTIVPLAPSDFAVRSLATVIPTKGNLKIPSVSVKSTATLKREATSGSDTSHAFTDTTPQLIQKTLTAYQIGGATDVSFELAEDTAALDGLVTPDLSDAVQEFEEDKYVNGTGVNEPEGVLTGADFGVANEDMDLDRILDLIDTLKDKYHANAVFLMQRQTSIALRKAQLSANLFDPVWTRVGNQDYLYGYPVRYSAAMPSISQGNGVMVFGDFRRGLVIGDRGGSAIAVKILDQAKAQYGLVEVLVYRRTDSRVRRSEALKTFVIDSAS